MVILFNAHGIALRHVGTPKALRRRLAESAELGEDARLLITLAINGLARVSIFEGKPHEFTNPSFHIRR